MENLFKEVKIKFAVDICVRKNYEFNPATIMDLLKISLEEHLQKNAVIGQCLISINRGCEP